MLLWRRSGEFPFSPSRITSGQESPEHWARGMELGLEESINNLILSLASKEALQTPPLLCETSQECGIRRPIQAGNGNRMMTDHRTKTEKKTKQ